MKTYYDVNNAPALGIRYIGCGEWTCTYEINKVTMSRDNESEEGQESSTVEMYECSEITTREKPTFDLVYTSIIRESYSEDKEYSMINSYNASKTGINIDQKKVEAYEKFLKWKESIKVLIKPIFDEGEIGIEELKSKKIVEINNYDSSESINGFYYQGMKMWIDKDTRVGLVNAANAAKSLGEETITVGISGLSINISINLLLNMLYRLEMYALECYNVTLSHKNNINSLETVQDIQSYDYTVGYPEMLNL